MKADGRVQLLAILLLMALGSSMISESWINQIDRLESQWLKSYLGPGRYSALQGAVLREIPESYGIGDFDPLFADAAVPSPEFATVLEWLKSRMRLMDKAVRRITQRLCLLELFAPLALLGVCLFSMDAAIVRQIRQHGFEYSSPLIHRTSLHALGLLLVILVLLVLLPLPLPPQILLIHMGLVCWVFWLNICHMPKRI